ncbi:primosomal protein N' [Gammaproteobacteria bacterium]|nr:primosomal protein N' [Gammaproteobacteria bacterium]
MYCYVAFKNFTKDLICYQSHASITSEHIGWRVIVPFGKKTCVGIIVRLCSKPSVDVSKIKSVIELLNPLYTTCMIKFFQQLSDYYLLSVNEVIVLATHHDFFDAETCLKPHWLQLTQDAQVNTKTEKSIANIAKTPTCIWTLKQYFPAKAIDKMLVSEKLFKTNALHQTPKSKLYQLSTQQQNIVSDIITNWQGTHLIHGVTGSGKTEIYTHLIIKALEQRQQVLVLVPEIALTEQTANKIADRTQKNVSILHSNLTQKQKLCRQMQARTGAAQIILGTRSALLCEFKELGLIIIDEEHDSSYRHHSPLFFSARDMGVLRAHLLNIPIILGSATPSLETLLNAHQQRYMLHVLDRRIHTRMPNIHLLAHDGQTLLAPEVTNAINQTLSQDKNVLVFIGRRGWAHTVYCIKCEWQARCSRCNAILVLHHNQSLQCHQCQINHQKPQDCPKCQQAELVSFGYGSQQVAHDLSNLWPNHTVLRFDTDQTPTELKEQFSSLAKKQSTIIVGTQMMTKGHDLASVQTVVVIDADQGLYAHDFRAEESLYAELVQTAGRCGRRQQPGEVWIQSKNPDHPLFRAIQTPKNFPSILLEKRQAYALPPYTYIAALYVLTEKDTQPDVSLPPELSHIQGPIPCPKGNRQHKLCWMFYISTTSRQERKIQLASLIQTLHHRKWKIWWQVDTYLCP